MNSVTLVAIPGTLNHVNGDILMNQPRPMGKLQAMNIILQLRTAKLFMFP